MLKVQEIREIIKLIDQSNIDEFSYEANGTKVHMKKPQGEVVSQPVQVQQPIQAPPKTEPKQEAVEQAPKQEAKEDTAEKEAPKAQGNADYDAEVKSPMVGTFYASPSPEEDVYVKVGDTVKEDSVVCIVEAMKLFNEIEAEVSGEIVEILVKDGELVEYGQPLFRVKSK